MIQLEDILKDKKKKLKKGTRKGKKVKRFQRGAESSSDEGSSSGEQEDVKKYDEVEEKLNTFGEILVETETEAHDKWGQIVYGPRVSAFPVYDSIVSRKA